MDKIFCPWLFSFRRSIERLFVWVQGVPASIKPSRFWGPALERLRQVVRGTTLTQILT